MKKIIFIAVTILFVLTSLAAPVKVACVGNSITYGAGIENRFQNSYPGILQQMLGDGYDVRNFGVSGTTVLADGDYPYTKTTAYRESLEFLPDVVTIKLGTNDSKPHNWKYGKSFEKDLRDIINAFKSLPSSPKIYLCIPVPCTSYSGKPINDSTITSKIIPLIRKVASSTGVELIDLYTPLKPHPEFFPDTIHPNAEGSAAIASVIYKHLTGNDAPSYNHSQSFPGTKTSWNGCDRYDFVFKGRQATAVHPTKPFPGNPWIWRPAFFGAFPSVDIDLLQKGYHIVYYDLTHCYGSPSSVRLGTEFFNLMTGTYHLSSKVTLEGFSRGGYYAMNWAAANPEKVASIYLDAPVCNIQSWPGRQSPLWEDFLKNWNITSDTVTAAFPGDAINLLTPLVRHHIPIIAVCGDSDKIVPYEDNLRPVLNRYKDMGGIIELILKPGCDHHPHSLDNPEPVSDFIMRYRPGYTDAQHITLRQLPVNAFYRFRHEKKGCVAFLGGSITEMRGWKDQIEEDLRQRFPECEFTFIEAGISSLGSTPHAFRMQKDLLDKGTPDLLFVEAAVNDDTNGFSATSQVRAMEGIVRHTLSVNPYTDIIMLHFIYDPFIPLHAMGIRPDVVMNHERVANLYRITSIDFTNEIATRLENKELTWEEFGGTHPAWEGAKYYTAAINRIFDLTPTQSPAPHTLPAPLDTLSYSTADLISPQKATSLHGFRLVPNWTPSNQSIATRKQYVNIPMLECTEPGSSLTLHFDGTAIGIYGTFGPNAALIEYSIDNSPYHSLDTYTPWSANLYIPWLYILDDTLPAGHHTLRLRTSRHSPRTGCLIYRFAVNRSAIHP